MNTNKRSDDDTKTTNNQPVNEQKKHDEDEFWADWWQTYWN